MCVHTRAFSHVVTKKVLCPDIAGTHSTLNKVLVRLFRASGITSCVTLGGHFCSPHTFQGSVTDTEEKPFVDSWALCACHQLPSVGGESGSSVDFEATWLESAYRSDCILTLTHSRGHTAPPA